MIKSMKDRRKTEILNWSRTGKDLRSKKKSSHQEDEQTRKANAKETFAERKQENEEEDNKNEAQRERGCEIYQNLISIGIPASLKHKVTVL